MRDSEVVHDFHLRLGRTLLHHVAVAALLSLGFFGCVAGPTREQIQNADYGSYPSNYEDIVKSHYSMYLKDPYSVVYAGISEPKQFFLGDRLSGGNYGYLVCATLNAKNSFGAFVGYQTDGLLIRNGSVVTFVDKGDWWGRNVCQMAAQMPSDGNVTKQTRDEAWAECFRQNAAEASHKLCMSLKGFSDEQETTDELHLDTKLKSERKKR